jgi:hypothetical protein
MHQGSQQQCPATSRLQDLQCYCQATIAPESLRSSLQPNKHATNSTFTIHVAPCCTATGDLGGSTGGRVPEEEEDEEEEGELTDQEKIYGKV